MESFESDIKNSVETIINGGVILYPTDTIWGLGCDALNKKAVDKIFSIKQRPANKSLIVLLAEAKDVLQYVAAPPPDIIDIIEGFDSPTTIIYNGALEFPENVINEDGSIAIRVTKDPYCKALIKRLQKPLISTSANISGHAHPNIFKDMSEDILSKVDYTVHYRREDNTIAAPSKIIKIDDEGAIEIIRA